MRKFFCLILCLLFPFCAAFGEELYVQSDTLTIRGSASVSIEADACTLQMGVETESTDVTAAQKDNADRTNAIRTALMALGAEEKSLTTGSFSIWSQDRYIPDSFGQETVETVYVVSNTLNITISALDQAGAWIDTAVAAGANRLYGLTFISSQSAEAYDRALVLACEDAFRKAGILAGACGVVLTGIKEIRLPDDYNVPGSRNATYKTAISEDAAYGTKLEAGDVIVEAAVEITWIIRPADQDR